MNVDALHDAVRAAMEAAVPERAEALGKVLAKLEEHRGSAVDEFLLKLFKVKVLKPKKPKKTAEDREREKAEKAAAAAEKKRIAAVEKMQKAEAAAQAKAAAKLLIDQEKQAAKAAEAHAKLLAAEKAVQEVIDDLIALLMRFRGGNVPQEAVDGELLKLKPMKAPQLYRIAQALNADATLTEKSTKAKITKQVSEMIRRVWKTSDNVNH